MADQTQICVQPLSSPYCVLLRGQTYALVVALFLPVVKGWLFRAALAAFTTRTAIFAVDAAVILHRLTTFPSQDEPLPLDVMVALEMLGLAVLMACWLLACSWPFRKSPARGLVKLWTVIVVVGAILAFVSVAKFGQLAAVDPGLPPTACAGIVVSRASIFGETVVQIPLLGKMPLNISVVEKQVGIPALVVCCLALVIAATPKAGPKRDQPKPRKRDLEFASPEFLDTSSTGLRAWLQPLQWVIVSLLAVGIPALAVFTAVISELFLLKNNVPSIEPMTSVGQWGPWAATGVVILATVHNALMKKMGLRKPKVAKKSPHEFVELEVKL